ncbi:MAG: SUMF1/EgtB/PvdO family nonheme iron enzyme [Candidatus Eremiobacterota bacterium]
MKILNALILVIITGIIIAGCGGGSSGYTGDVPSVEPTSTVIPALTPAAPSAGGVFKITVNIPGYELSKKDSLTANVLPCGSKTLRVTITGEAIDPPMIVETPIPSPVPSPLTLTVSGVPVGLNEALLEVLDNGDNFLAGYKYGFYMKSGETVSPPGALSPGVVITESKYNPQNIEISAGGEVYFQNWDSVDSTVKTSPALSPPLTPLKGVIAAVQPNIPSLYDGTSYIFNVADTYNYSGKSGTITVYGLPLLSDFSPTSGYEGDEITITGSNFSANPSGNTVSFNGVNAEVTSASTTTLTVKVPAGATTGKISMTTPGGTVTSAENFIVTDTSGKMVLLPAGTFQMGDLDGGVGDSDERPRHEVTITYNFYMSRCEVTNQEYLLYDPNHTSIGGWTDPNYPVQNVSWFNAAEYCNWLTDTTPGLGSSECCYNGSYNVDITKKGYRLPTEAEWEYACRAGETTFHDYYWGDSYPNPSYIGDNCWYDSNSDSHPHIVGTKLPNNFGLFDMSGNLWEWVNDWYLYGSYSVDDPNNPVGPGSGSFRVLRGGSWNYYAVYCRSAGRYGGDPSYRNGVIGFRPVRSAP